MVAYTPEFCLPYFEGTDSPCVDIGQVCAPQSVWCSMAAIVDAALTEADDLLARTAYSFPYAQVAVTQLPIILDTGITNAGSVLVTWDAVLGDSDNMANLTEDPNSIYLRRSGIWHISAIAEAISDDNDTNIALRVEAPFGSGLSPVTFTTANRPWVEPAAVTGGIIGELQGLSAVYSQFMRADVSTGAVSLQTTLTAFGSGSGIVQTYNDVRLAARWVADLP